jgi:hypothetical protein
MPDTAFTGRVAEAAMSARPMSALNLAGRRHGPALAWVGHFRVFGEVLVWYGPRKSSWSEKGAYGRA